MVNHRQNLAEEFEKIGYPNVDYILCLNETDSLWKAMIKAIKPQGIIDSIMENQQPLDMDILKTKSAGLLWEFMFTPSMYQTEDMVEPSNLLNELSQLIENGVIITTCNNIVKPINAKNLRDVHQRLEKGKAIGKIVVTEWNESCTT